MIFLFALSKQTVCLAEVKLMCQRKSSWTHAKDHLYYYISSQLWPTCDLLLYIQRLDENINSDQTSPETLLSWT